MPPVSASRRLDRLPPVPRRVLADNQRICRGWLEWLGAHGRQPLTVYQYGSKCDEFIEFLGPKPIDSVTLSAMEAWVARPRKGRGHGQLGSDSTRAKDIIMLRGLWKWGVAHGHFLSNPTIELEIPTVKNHNPRAIARDVWHDFWTAPLEDEERVAYGLGFYCGLRREEICRLEPQHVDPKLGRIVDFKRKGDRNSRHTGSVPYVSLARLFAQNHPRLLPDVNAFLGPLERLQEVRSDAKWLLPWGERSAARMAVWRTGPRLIPEDMTNPDQINHRLRVRLRELDMADAFTPHALRHSFVTYLLKGGVALEVASKLANHSDVNITMRYISVDDDPIADLLPSLKGTRW